MELEIQKYLRAGHSLEGLKEPPYSLIIKEKENLVLFKYTQGESDGFNPIVKECRGIILDRDNNWKVVCHAFDRFYNVGQPEAAVMGQKLRVYEKVDGAIVKFYCYKDKWYCASNSTIDACECYIDGKWNFFDLVEKALATYGLTFDYYTFKFLDKRYTYIYELVCPETRQIVDYGGDRKLYYLGERNIETNQEYYCPARDYNCGVSNVEVYQFATNTMEEVMKQVESLGDNAEGFVVVDENWNRVKVKTTNYFKLHYMAKNGKPNPYEIILTHEDEEFLSYFPYYKEMFDKARLIIEEIENVAMALAARARYEALQRTLRGEFAKRINQVPKYFQAFMFRVYSNPDLTWHTYTKDWDWNKWKLFLKKYKGD